MNFQHFLRACPLRFWPFTMLLHFSLKKNSPKFASVTTKKMGSNRWMLQRILQQNASHFVSKRIAICTKTQCILHQNAVQYAPKCKVKCYKTEVKCCKMQPKPIKCTILGVIYRHFDHLE